MKRGGGLRRRTALRRLGARVLRAWRERASFRAEVLRRARGRCERCGAGGRLQAHHVLPRGRGGTDDPANGAALCSGPRGCHAAVHDATAPDWRDWLQATAPARAEDSHA